MICEVRIYELSYLTVRNRLWNGPLATIDNVITVGAIMIFRWTFSLSVYGFGFKRW